MRLLMSLIGVLGMFVFALSGTQAHHAFSGEFDSTKPINLRGKVCLLYTSPSPRD